MIMFALVASSTGAKAQTDSLYMHIDSTTFSSRRHTSSIREVRGGATRVDIRSIRSMPKILGNSDPVNFIRNLPGVQTGSEYDSGIHIQGCENAHNDISLAGVPVYGANHLFGLFSVFNPTHFSQMTFSRASATNRLGGSLRMELPDTLKQRVSGETALGMMAAQGTIGVRIGESTHLRVSARQSYLNLLYKPWLRIESSPIRYGFGDYNISLMFNPTSRDRIWIEGYYGRDDAAIDTKGFDIGISSDWGNHAGSVHWRHEGTDAIQYHTIFTSGFSLYGNITQNESEMSLKTFINTAGYIGTIQWENLNIKAEVNLHDILPQQPQSEGLYGITSTSEGRMSAIESSVLARYRKMFADRWTIEAGIRAGMYVSPENSTDLSLLPDISLSYNAYRLGKITASCGMHRQNLFQTGLSNIGLPIEFWFPAGDYSAPQISRHADISYEAGLFRDMFRFSVGAYYKRLYNQVEYKGDLLDFFNSTYDLNDHLLKGDGWNYGLNVMIHKQSGSLTGWVSYSAGRALRKFNNPDYSGIYPANHERIHELNTVATYSMDRWNFSSTFVYASGAPFTAPEYYYLSSGHIITKYGEHNGCRMRPYVRMDISVSYQFIKKKNRESGIDFSVYNVTGRSNDVMYRLNASDGKYSFGPMAFFLRFVPSISWHHRF